MPCFKRFLTNDFKIKRFSIVDNSVDGVEISDIVRSAGKPSRLVSNADRYSINADGCDLSFITVDVVDNRGVVVPNADNMIKFSVSGPAKIVGVDNGNPICHESFKGTQHSAFNGKCLCIIQSVRGDAGRVVLTAEADGLHKTQVEIYTK